MELTTVPSNWIFLLPQALGFPRTGRPVRG